jgi:hypothetical protein
LIQGISVSIDRDEAGFSERELVGLQAWVETRVFLIAKPYRKRIRILHSVSR